MEKQDPFINLYTALGQYRAFFVNCYSEINGKYIVNDYDNYSNFKRIVKELEASDIANVCNKAKFELRTELKSKNQLRHPIIGEVKPQFDNLYNEYNKIAKDNRIGHCDTIQHFINYLDVSQYLMNLHDIFYSLMWVDGLDDNERLQGDNYKIRIAIKLYGLSEDFIFNNDWHRRVKLNTTHLQTTLEEYNLSPLQAIEIVNDTYSLISFKDNGHKAKQELLNTLEILRVSDNDFIMQNKINEKFVPHGNDGEFIISKDGKSRTYAVGKYFELLLQNWQSEIESTDDEVEKLNIINNAILYLNEDWLRRDHPEIVRQKETNIKHLQAIQTHINNDPYSDTNATKKIESNFVNNFDFVEVNEVYSYFKTALLDRKHLTESQLSEYLKFAFEKKTQPKKRFKLKGVITKNSIQSVFYIYYKEIAGKPHGRQPEYASLLGEYFEGYNTENVRTNFNK